MNRWFTISKRFAEDVKASTYETNKTCNTYFFDICFSIVKSKNEINEKTFERFKQKAIEELERTIKHIKQLKYDKDVFHIDN